METIKTKRILTIMAACLMVIGMQAQSVVMHTVMRGETLESIANVYHVTVEDIQTQNPDTKEYFYVGMKLEIPQKRQELSTNGAPAATPLPTEQTPSNSSVLYTANLSQTDAASNNSASTDNPLHIFFRLGPTFAKMPEEEGSYSWAFNYEAVWGVQYYFSENLYGHTGLGWTNFSSSMRSYGTKTESSFNNVSLPIELGFEIPFTKSTGIFLEAGPTVNYLVNGYIKINGEKKKISEMEKEGADIDHLSAFLKVGGGIKLWDFRIQFHYAIQLTNPPYGEKTNSWGITIGSVI